MSGPTNMQVHFTDKDGNECKIFGDSRAIEVLEKIMQKAGIRWNEEVGTWDAGYYKRSPQSSARP